MIRAVTDTSGNGAGGPGMRVSLTHSPCGIPFSSHNDDGLVIEPINEISCGGVSSVVMALFLAALHTLAR